MSVNVCQVLVEQPSYTVRNVDRLVPMDEFIRECVRVFQFALLCAECENYGHRWTCPPFDFAPMQLWCKYKSIWLFGRILTPETDVEASAMLGKLIAPDTVAVMRSAGIDICGENGEYHTLAVDGPVFRSAVPYRLGGILELEHHAVIDIQ